MIGSHLWTNDDIVQETEGYGPKTVDKDYSGIIVGCIFVIRDDGALLMQLRDDMPGLRHAGLWVPPGGHMELGETLIETAVREFHEETQLKCQQLQWLNAIEVNSHPWPRYLLGMFWTLYNNKPFECHEGQELKFVEPGVASQYPMPLFVAEVWKDILLRADCKEELVACSIPL